MVFPQQCSKCYGQLDTGLKCIKCGNQEHVYVEPGDSTADSK